MTKKITIKNRKMNANDLRAIEAFNAFFKEDEVQLRNDGGKITIFLRTVDIAVLKNIAAHLSGGAKTVLDEVVDAILKIKSYGIHGGKRHYVGYNQERKVLGRKQKEARRGRYYYARDGDFSNHENPMPGPFINQIISGDSEAVLAKIPDNSVDIVFTSPPYNFGLNYPENPDDRAWEEYFAKLFKILKSCIRVLRYGGRLIVNIQPLYSDYIPSHHIISDFLRREKLIWKGEILWEKNNYNCKYTAWGSWKSPSNPYLKYTWEFLEIFAKGSLKKSGARDNIDIQAEEFKKWVVGKWGVAPERRMKDYDHPAMFPEELVVRALKLFSYRGDFVLDPFNGAGTTTAVAAKLGRQYLGIDISAEYCKTAKQRIENLNENTKLRGADFHHFQNR